MDIKNPECVKLSPNTIIVNNTNAGRGMEEISRNVDYGDRKIRVILQFPEELQETDQIQDTVKAILVNELQDRIRKAGRSGTYAKEENREDAAACEL